MAGLAGFKNKKEQERSLYERLLERKRRRCCII